MSLTVRLQMERLLVFGKERRRESWLIKPISDVTQREWQKDLKPRLRREVAQEGLVAYRRRYPALHVMYRDDKFYCARDGVDCTAILARSGDIDAAANPSVPFCPAPGSPEEPFGSRE